MNFSNVARVLNESLISLKKISELQSGLYVPCIVDTDFIQKLVYLLTGPNYQAIKDTVELIGLFTCKDECIPLLLQSNLFDQAQTILLSECPDFLKQEVCWILSNFGADTQTTINCLIDHEVFNTIL